MEIPSNTLLVPLSKFNISLIDLRLMVRVAEGKVMDTFPVREFCECLALVVREKGDLGAV